MRAAARSPGPRVQGEVGSEGLLSWRGPEGHVLWVQRGGRAMSPETARRALDFAWTVPCPALTVELRAEEPDAAWATILFAVQHAERRAEWHSRRVSVWLRSPRPPGPERLASLEARGVGWRSVLCLRGGPAAPLPGAARAIAFVEASAASPAGWVDALAEAGARSVLLEPARRDDRRAVARFLGFYRAAAARMLERGDLFEERAAALLSRRRRPLPGLDLLSELCYGPDGTVYSSEAGAELAESGRTLLALGGATACRWADLARSETVRALLAACLPENQPLCFHCAYRSRCSAAPSLHLRSQGTLWGQTPSSAACALNMGILDALGREAGPAGLGSLEGWGEG